MSTRVVYRPTVSKEAHDKIINEELERFLADDTAEEFDEENVKLLMEIKRKKDIINTIISNEMRDMSIIAVSNDESDSYFAKNIIIDGTYKALHEDDGGEAYVEGVQWSTRRMVKIRVLTSQGRELYRHWKYNFYDIDSEYTDTSYAGFVQKACESKYSTPLSLTAMLGSDLDTIGDHATI